MILVTKRSQLSRFINYLAPEYLLPGASVLVAATPEALHDLHDSPSHALLLDIPSVLSEEVADDFAVNAELWLHTNVHTTAAAIFPRHETATHRKLRPRLRAAGVAVFITDDEALNKDYWKGFYKKSRQKVLEHGLIDDLKRTASKLDEVRLARWNVRAPLLLQIADMARTQSTADQIAIALYGKNCKSKNLKNACRQRLFTALTRMNAPQCKTIVQLVRTAWVWKLRTCGVNTYADIAQFLGCPSTAAFRACLLMHTGLKIAEVDLLTYDAVLNAVVQALVSDNPPNSSRELYDSITNRTGALAN